tara:strand:+ start:3600 stop:3929 length:330 start_codon:yes stop_codon:yes gene_type:complete
MNLVSPSKKIHNSKLFFSKEELKKILNCYSLGVSRGNWKDYAINFKKNEAIFFIYKHSFASPDCILKKLHTKKNKRIIFKLLITNKLNSNYNNIDELITSLRRKQFKVL